MKHSVKFFVILVLLILNCSLLKAQKHFIYIQSEDKQPFAVVMSGKVYSSSDYGYVIIPKLTDGTYNFTVSFPLNKFPDQSFSCTINKKDEGYTLKNNTGGWALQNLQTQNQVANNNTAAAQQNAFGDMLSDVVSDSSLNKKNAVVLDTVATSKPLTTDSIFQPQKIAESNIDTGTTLVFVDKDLKGTDTVNVFIPSEAAASSPAVTESNNQPVITDTVAASNPQPVTNNIITDNTPTDNSVNANSSADTTATKHDVSNPFYKPDQSANSAVATTSAASVTSTPISSAINSAAVRQNCDNMLSDDDMSKLKRKMFTRSTDKDMIDYAVKYLDKKCISTDQVKTLGQLFSSDDGRYNLFDALYSYTYDYGKYTTLSNQIIDPYYKKRFMALLR